MQTLKGNGVCNGIACGKIFFINKASVNIERKPTDDIPKELNRLENAVTKGIEELEELRKKTEKYTEKNGAENIPAGNAGGKRGSYSQRDREKRKLKRGIKEKIPAGKTVQQRKKGGRAKNKRSGGAKADRCEKNACKISADGGENKIYRQVPDRDPDEKKHLKRRAPSAGADHIFGRSGRNRQKRYSL